MNKDRNRPSSQSEHSFEHPFHHCCDSYSVFLRRFFFYLSNPSCPVYVWSAATMLKSLRTTFENVSESWNVTGLPASFCVDGIDFSFRNRPGIFADYATESVCASDEQRWMQTPSGVAHDLPQGPGFYHVSSPGGGRADTTLSQHYSSQTTQTYASTWRRITIFRIRAMATRLRSFRSRRMRFTTPPSPRP